uniref:Uncharacterized protein n=1 Tax=Percolomonas cosmopolitus TaxID=63605 RepID=A0A7S1KQP3_9EUKA|mmetsp:Transcript_5521/g.20753  ORF Transcript_5521/g.20753 Transcript_5521/m.20753 type:complete len:395 (+) Transcript_5521:20-1204(+)
MSSTRHHHFNLHLSPSSSKLPTSTPLSLSLYLLSRIHHPKALSHSELQQVSKEIGCATNEHSGAATSNHQSSDATPPLSIIFTKNAASYHAVPLMVHSGFIINEHDEQKHNEQLMPWIALNERMATVVKEQSPYLIYDYFEILHVLLAEETKQENSRLLRSGSAATTQKNDTTASIQHLFFVYHRLLPLVYFHHLYFPSKNYFSYIVPTIQRSMRSLWGQISVPHRTRKNMKDKFQLYWSNEQFSKGLGFDSELFASKVEMKLILNRVNELVADSTTMRDERLRCLLYGCLAVIYYVDMPRPELRNLLQQYPKLIAFVKQCSEQYLPQRYQSSLAASTAADEEIPETEEVSVHHYVSQELNNREEEQHKRRNKLLLGTTLLGTGIAWLGMNYVF